MISKAFTTFFAFLFVKLAILASPVQGAGAVFLRDDFNAASLSLSNTFWEIYDKGTAEIIATENVLRLDDTHAVTGDMSWTDYELEFRARAPSHAEDVQIFASLRYTFDTSRYVVGVRGGNNNDVFVARYSTGGNDRILKVQPLGFAPVKDTWYIIRVTVVGNSRITVCVEDDDRRSLSTVSVADHGSPLVQGAIALGGGWNLVEYDYVEVREADGQQYRPPSNAIVKLNFQDLNDPAVDGWLSIDGSAYTREKRHGFDRDSFTLVSEQLTSDGLYDRFVGVHIGNTTFLYDLPLNEKGEVGGDYVVSLQMGRPREKTQCVVFFQDETQPSLDRIVDADDSIIFRKSISIIGGGQLKVRFRRDHNFNAYINWLSIERREDVGEHIWNFHLLATPHDDDENGALLRSISITKQKLRAKYQGISISKLSSARSVHSLNGDWLFLPAQELTDGPLPWHVEANDQEWHIMDVPNFWTPHYAWTYMDADQGRGSANWVRKEKSRCEGYTFDYETTNVAYYRQHIFLPPDITGRTSHITFHGIGKDAEIWVNGKDAGVHAGLFTTTKLDVSNLLQAGENIITVKVGDFMLYDITDPSVPGVIEREPIDRKFGERLYPNGMLFSMNLGIWQGVSLIVSKSLTIEDSFFQPGLNDFSLRVTLANKGTVPQRFSVCAQIRSYEDNTLVYDSFLASRLTNLTMMEDSKMDVVLTDTVEHAPYLNWSPEHPNLYKMDIFSYRYNQDPSDSVNLTDFSSSAIKLNFQPIKAVTPVGWRPIGGEMYDSSIGYGWNVQQHDRQRGSSMDPLLDTLVTIDRNTEATFSYDVDDGDYVLTLQFGDPLHPTAAEAFLGSDSNNMDMVIVRDAVDANGVVVVLKSLTVTDGKLKITIPSMSNGSIGTSVSYLVLEPRLAVTEAKWQLGLKHFEILDHESYDVGFRTFAVEGDEFILNGFPYKIRGANHCPNILRPNDEKLADWFTKKVHDKNINFSRAHSVPMNDVWFNAANKNGLAISQEGTWPWLMFGGRASNIPSAERIRLWQREWLSLVNKYKNHPSLLLWTMNNEMKFFLENEYEPWKILSDTIKATRSIDPTRPVIADSGYARKMAWDGLPAALPGTDDPIVAVAGPGQQRIANITDLDDGDVDDVHKYYGWYDNDTFFSLRDGVTFGTDKTPGRPYISQELSTGYPDADTGHAIKHYIYTHINPQAWVGRWAFEDKDPRYFLERHALITKETAEVFRTTYRKISAGVMMFSLNSWFKNVYDVNSISPWPTLDAVSMAHEPVMASVYLNGRNFYTGAVEEVDAFVVNDSTDRENFDGVVVEWQVVYNNNVLSFGRKDWSMAGQLAYFDSFSGTLTFTVPDKLPEAKITAELVLNLYGNGRYLSTNRYSILVCEQDFAKTRDILNVGFFGNSDGYLKPLMERLGIHVITPLDSLTSLRDSSALLYDAVIVGSFPPEEHDSLREYIRSGGRVLFQDSGDQVMALFPNEIYRFHSRAREIVTPTLASFGTGVFTDLDPTDLSWFQGSENFSGSPKQGHVPYAASCSYNVLRDSHAVTPLGETTEIHGYKSDGGDRYHPDKTIDDIQSSPLLEVKLGSGSAIVSCMLFEATADPIGNRLLINVLAHLAKKSGHHHAPPEVGETFFVSSGSFRGTAVDSAAVTTSGLALCGSTLISIILMTIAVVGI